MSSEMREVDQLGFALQRLLTPKQWEQEAITDRLNAIRALLARTEAGADGVIDITSRDYQAGFDAGVDFYDDGSGRNRDWRSTRPQDASGDAVAELIAAADVLNTGAKHGLSTYPEDWKRLDAALDAMQAKEAK